MAETLSLPVEVTDKFTGPLRKLRQEFANIHPPKAIADAGREFDKFHQAVKNVTTHLTGPFNQAISGLGISSLGAIASIGGVASAVKKFSDTTIFLKEFERETGIAASTLKTFRAAAGTFGADADSLGSSLKGFASNIYDVKRGMGNLPELLSGQFGDLAKKLRDPNAPLSNSLNDALHEAAKVAEQGNPERAKRLLSSLKLDAFLPFVLRGTKALDDAMREFSRGGISEADEQKAIAFAKAWEKLDESISSVGKTIGREFTPVFATAMGHINDFLDANKGAIKSGIQTAFEEIGKAVRDINWQQVGTDIKDVVGALAQVAHWMGWLAEHASPGKGIVDNTKREFDSAGRTWGGLKKLFTQPLGETLNGIINNPWSDKDPAGGATLGSGPAGANPAFRDLQEQLQKKATKEGTSEGIEDAFRKMSLTGSGVGGGARIWNASYGGGGGSGGGFSGGPGGGSLGGGSSGGGTVGGGGASGAGDFGVHSGGGRFNGLGALLGGGRGGGAARDTGSQIFDGKPGKLSSNQREAYAAAIEEGLSSKAARALVANMSGESLRNPRDHHWDRKHMSQGIVQWDPQRSAAIAKQFGKEPRFLSVADQTRAAIWEMKNNKRFAPTWRALHGDNEGAMLGALVGNYEAPQNVRGEIAKRSQIYSRLGHLDAGDRRGSLLSMQENGSPSRMNGRHAIDLTINGLPGKGVRTKVHGEGGFFREINVNRGRSMVPAREDD